jgi:hypothetical protein
LIKKKSHPILLARTGTSAAGLFSFSSLNKKKKKFLMVPSNGSASFHVFSFHIISAGNIYLLGDDILSSLLFCCCEEVVGGRSVGSRLRQITGIILVLFGTKS